MKTIYTSLTEAEALQLINTKLSDVQDRIETVKDKCQASWIDYEIAGQIVKEQLRQLIDVEYLFRDLKNAKENT